MNAPREKRRTTFTSLLRTGTVLSFVGIALFFAFRYLTVDQLDEEIRRRVEEKFRKHYSGLHVSVESARRIEGAGIEILGLTVAEVDRRNKPLLYVERILAECDTRLPEFVTQPTVVRAIHIRRAHIHAARRPNGFWNVRHLFPLPVSNNALPPLDVEESTIEIMDDSRPEAKSLVLRDIRLAFHRDAEAAPLLGLPPERMAEAIRMEGELSGDHFQKIRLEGILDRRVEVWQFEGGVDGLEFDPALLAALPRDIATHMTPLAAIRGNTHFQFQVDNIAGPAQPWRFAVSGSMSEGRIDDERLPMPLTDVSARVHGDNAGFHIDALRAHFGDADIEMSFRFDGYESTSPLVMRVAAKNLSLDDRLAEALPEDLRAWWKKIGLEGELNGHCTLQYDGRNWIPEFDGNLSSLSLLYEQFPYRLTEGEAKVRLRNNLITLSGQASAGNSRVKCSGEIRNPGPGWSGWLEASTLEPVPIDERLLQALAETPRKVVRSFHARGTVGLLARLDRRAGVSNASHYQLDVQLHDCSLAYENFPYPIDHVHGTLRNRDGSWNFVDLRGTQGTAGIQCSGSFGPQGELGSLLSLEFHNVNVPLDDTLRKALSVANQRLWDDFRPRGELEALSVKLHYWPRTKQMDLEISGEKITATTEQARPLSVEPVWFPYELDIRSGLVRYRDGTLELHRIRAKHEHVKIETDGTFRWNKEGAWTLEFPAMSADRLQLDHDLLAAFPAEFGKTLARAKFMGALGMTGALTFTGTAGKNTGMNSSWNLHFDVEDGRLAGEIPVEHIHGGIDVRGSLEDGKWTSYGDVRFDSAFCKEVQLTNVRGPFLMNNREFMMGSWAEREKINAPPKQLLAQVFNGLLATDARVSLEEGGEFQLECTLEQANLAQIARENNFATEDISGKAFGVVQVTGTTRGKHTWRGGGNIRLRDAYIYKVPAMIALLKLLSIRSPDSTAFTTCDIDFRIQGDDVVFDRLDLGGDAISLKGRGRLYEQKQVDLLFYTQMGRSDTQPRLIRPLLAEASPLFLLIEVTGTLDDPQMKKTAFPAINETLRELFPEIAREKPLERR